MASFAVQVLLFKFCYIAGLDAKLLLYVRIL